MHRNVTVRYGFCNFPYREIPLFSGFRSRGKDFDMPFPLAVGRVTSALVLPGGEAQIYEVITSDNIIYGSNVGNHMLRNMGSKEALVCETDF